MGRMTESEALRSPLRNVITRALGTQNCVTPDSFELETEPGDVFTALLGRVDAGAE